MPTDATRRTPPCAGCLGTGECWVCTGTGISDTGAGVHTPCRVCAGARTCTYCDGIAGTPRRRAGDGVEQ